MKKDWIYIVLLLFIVGAYCNTPLREKPRLAEKKEETGIEDNVGAYCNTPLHSPEKEKPRGMFVDFKEAQERSGKIENMLKVGAYRNTPLLFFYISLNLSIVFLFLLGLGIDGHFIFKKSKKDKIFEKSLNINPPSWKIIEIFKIIILAFALSYVFFIVLSFLIGLTESFAKTEFRFYKNENFRMIFDTLILDFFILSSVLAFLWRVHGKKLSQLGLSAVNMPRNILYGVMGYVGIIPVILIIGVFIYIILNIFHLKPPPQPIVGLFLSEENIKLVFTSSLIAAVFGPVIEEIFFRGVMYNAVKRKFGIFWGILITSVLFSFLHTHAATYLIVGFVPIAILGAVLAYLYEKTGSLVPSITLHILNNLGSVIMVFAFKYFNSFAGTVGHP